MKSESTRLYVTRATPDGIEGKYEDYFLGPKDDEEGADIVYWRKGINAPIYESQLDCVHGDSFPFTYYSKYTPNEDAVKRAIISHIMFLRENYLKSAKRMGEFLGNHITPFT